MSYEKVYALKIDKVENGYVINVRHMCNNISGARPHTSIIGFKGVKHYVLDSDIIKSQSKEFVPFKTKYEAEEEIVFSYLEGEFRGGGNKYERAALATPSHPDQTLASLYEDLEIAKQGNNKKWQEEIWNAINERIDFCKHDRLCQAMEELYRSAKGHYVVRIGSGVYLTSLRKGSYDYSYKVEDAKVFTIYRNALGTAMKLFKLWGTTRYVEVINLDTNEVEWTTNDL